MKARRCYKCRNIKAINEFVKNKSKKYGYDYQCRECRRARDKKNKAKRNQWNKEWYKKNRNRILKHAKEYRMNHPEKLENIVARNKVYYKRNRQKVLAQKKKYYQNHREEILARNKIRYLHDPEKLKNIRKSSRKNWQKNNPTKYGIVLRHKRRKAIDELKNTYIKILLKQQGVPMKVMNNDIIEIKRLLIKIKRHVKENKKADKQPTRIKVQTR